MDAIDDLLVQWYEWEFEYTPKLSYGSAEPACRGFRTSRQWMDYDDLNEEVERSLRAATGKIVEPMIQKLDTRHRLAVNTAMRNFLSGSEVWVNPRFPETQEVDYARAKRILCPQMVAAGILERNACKVLETVSE